jgi:hypothetical protein
VRYQAALRPDLPLFLVNKNFSDCHTVVYR